jgi:hypothetical protein
LLSSFVTTLTEHDRKNKTIRVEELVRVDCVVNVHTHVVTHRATQ